MNGVPHHSATLAIVLGASRFPQSTSFGSNPAFARSANAFRTYLERAPYGLGLPPGHVLDLFESKRTPHDQYLAITEFLAIHGEAKDLIIYYVGHGGFLPNRDFFLAIHDTIDGREFATVLEVEKLDLAVQHFRHKRRFVILDCCFAGEAVHAFQGSEFELAQRRVADAFPASGTALLLASSKDDVALAPMGEPYTRFSGCLLETLTQGIQAAGPRFSLSELGDEIFRRLRASDGPGAPHPEVHSPRQTEGDVARLPFFPNPAFRDVPRIEREPRPTPPDPAPRAHVHPFWRRLQLVLSPLLAFAAGWLVVHALFVFLRNEADDAQPTPVGVKVGVVAFVLFVQRYKIAGIALASWTGILLCAKPFMRPVTLPQFGGEFSPTSQTHLDYLVPGVVLLALSVLAGLTIIPAVEKQKLKSLLRPRFMILLCATVFAAGVGFAAANLSGPITAQVLASFQPEFDTLRRRLHVIGARLPPPGTTTGLADPPTLSPKPIHVEKRFGKFEGNTEILPVEQALDPDAKAAFDLYLHTSMLLGLLWTGPKNPMSSRFLDSKPSSEFATELRDALHYRYIVLYRSLSVGDMAMEVFLADLETLEILVAFRTPLKGDYSAERTSLATALRRATGGTFQFGD